MATEPTLGTRILDAVFRWQFERALNGIEAGRAEYDTLAALAARADAAERLAKAAVALPIARAKWVAAEDASDIIDAFEAFTVVRKEHEQAADMWRVIEGNEVTR